MISKEGYAAGDMFLFDNENGALLHGTEGGGFEPEVKHGGEKGSVKVTGNTEWLNLIAHDSLEKEMCIRDRNSATIPRLRSRLRHWG